MTSKLNWRIIVAHFIAFWFFIHAFETFSYLFDTRLLDLVRHSTDAKLESNFRNNNVSASEITRYAFWISTSGFVGLILAFIFSLIISVKQHWSWINSAIVLVITFSLYKIDLLGTAYAKQFIWRIGQLFNDSKIEFLVNGGILLLIGLAFFFLSFKTSLQNRRFAI